MKIYKQAGKGEFSKFGSGRPFRLIYIDAKNQHILFLDNGEVAMYDTPYSMETIQFLVTSKEWEEVAITPDPFTSEDYTK